MNVPEPNSCAYCGIVYREHTWRWWYSDQRAEQLAAGLVVRPPARGKHHQYVEPSTALRLRRMKARRATRQL